MLIYLGSLIAVILIGTLAIGDGFVGGEYDIGTTIFSLLFIFAPLMMLMYVFNDVSKKSEIEEVEELASSKSTKIVGLYIASGTILVLGGLILSLGMICIIKPNLMASFFNFSNNILFYLGIVFTIIATFSLFSGIGLLFKLNAARLFAMITSALLLIFLFPLVIVFYLSQNDVKELFIKTGSQ